jgi:hypothetical protein
MTPRISGTIERSDFARRHHVVTRVGILGATGVVGQQFVVACSGIPGSS